MKITADAIKTILEDDDKLEGNVNLIFNGMNGLNEAVEKDIVWIKPAITNIENLVNNTLASAIICDVTTFSLFKGSMNNKLFIISKNPKRVYVSIVKYISKLLKHKEQVSIHPTAIISSDCIIGANVQIGAYAVIGACKIGNETVIGEYVKIFDPVTIGNNCLIREHCSIGGEGFGYYKSEQNINEHIPHIGSVIIHDNVEIYPYSNVDRGTLGITEIKKGVVIDHYVHIGHNTKTGSNTIITAGVVLAGGSEIGENCFLGVKTIVKEKCKVGANVLTGMGSVVVKNIDSNSVVVGNPAKFLKPNTK